MKRNKSGPLCVALILFVVLLTVPGLSQQATNADEAEKNTPSSTDTVSSNGTKPPDSTDKVVLRVGNTQVTQGEMDQMIAKMDMQARSIIARRGRRPVVDEYIKMLVLSQRAEAEHLDTSPAVKPLLDRVRAETLAEAEYEDMRRKTEVTSEEVSQYFAAHTADFELVRVREFVVRQRPADSNDPKKGLAPAQAKAKAEAIRKALLAGTDIEKAVEKYGDAPNVQMVDKTIRARRRENMRPDLSEATFAVKGEGVSELVITPETIYIVKVFGHVSPELKDVQDEIAGKLKQQKLDAELEDMKKKAGIWFDDQYFAGRSLPAGLTREAPHP